MLRWIKNMMKNDEPVEVSQSQGQSGDVIERSIYLYHLYYETFLPARIRARVSGFIPRVTRKTSVDLVNILLMVPYFHWMIPSLLTRILPVPVWPEMSSPAQSLASDMKSPSFPPPSPPPWSQNMWVLSVAPRQSLRPFSRGRKLSGLRMPPVPPPFLELPILTSDQT